mgnify:CR=1 FL=1
MAESNKEVRQSYLNKARADKFRVAIPLPAVLRNIDTRLVRSPEFVDKDALTFSVFAIDVPALAVESVDLKYAGQTPRASSLSRTPFEPVTIKYVIDNQYRNYWLLYKWFDMLHDESKGHMDINKGANQILEIYLTDVTVTGLDEYNKSVIEYSFTHCVPVEIGALSYDYQETNEIESSFKFRFHQLKIKIV